MKNNNYPLLIAELSANHNQSLETALKTIKAASDAGADGIKLQTYTPDTLTIDCDKEYFHIKNGTVWDGSTLYSLYQKAYTPWEWHRELFLYAHSLDLICFSTPFDNSAVDFLETLNNPIYKIASFEINDIPLIRYAARCKKPMILSTGIATLEEIQEAIEACYQENNDDITILVCTSSYPAPLEEANLARIPDLRNKFNVKVGLSDHTMGDSAAVVASVLGASMIEKHFILDRKLGSADSSFSMEPDEFKLMKKHIKEACDSLGNASYQLSPKVQSSTIFKRSLFVCSDIKTGEIFSKKNIRSIRPGFGLAPKYFDKVLGKKAKYDIPRGEPLQWDMIAEE